MSQVNSYSSIQINRHGTKSSRKERGEESRKSEGDCRWRKEEEERKEKGKLCYLHLQSVEAGSP